MTLKIQTIYLGTEHLSRSWLSSTIFNLLGTVPFKELSNPEVVEEGGEKKLKFDITLTINGIDVDFLKFVEHLSSSFDDNVNCEARRLIKEKCNDLDNAMYKLIRNIEDCGRELFPKDYEDD